MPTPRVIILANRKKEPVTEALKSFRPWLEERAEIVAEPESLLQHREDSEKLPPADLILILGGDGTFLSQARACANLGVPLLGINFGKLGFLAEFSIETFQRHWDAIAAGRLRMTRRMLLLVEVFDADCPLWGGSDASLPEPVWSSIAMNDAVINAGEPFRMVEVELAIEPQQSHVSATSLAGDGLIVSTPTGSTAYNLAAGGPIVSPGINGLCVSATTPHSLAFRPIVYSASCDTWLYIRRANSGTMLVLDGQRRTPIHTDHQLRITRYPRDVTVAHNPDFNYWSMLAEKMHWAARPQRG